MKNRRHWLAIVAAASIWLVTRPLSAQEGIGSSVPIQQGRGAASLRDQLLKGLRVTRPEQELYVETVVQAVEGGRLPQALVNLIFRWALERNSRVPFPYFQYALTALAKRRGIAL